MSGISNVTTLNTASMSFHGGMKGAHSHGSVKAQGMTAKADLIAPEAKSVGATKGPMDASCGMKGMHDKEGSQQKGNSIDFRL